MQFGRHGTTPLGLDGTGSTVGWLIGLDYLLVPEFHWMPLQFLLRLSMLVRSSKEYELRNMYIFLSENGNRLVVGPKTTYAFRI